MSDSAIIAPEMHYPIAILRPGKDVIYQHTGARRPSILNPRHLNENGELENHEVSCHPPQNALYLGGCVGSRMPANLLGSYADNQSGSG